MKMLMQVRIDENYDGVARIRLRCTKLERQCRAAAVRLLAALDSAPDIWTETAGVVVESDEWCWSGWFPKPVSEWPTGRPAAVNVRLRWTELPLPTAGQLRVWDSPAVVRCRWQLRHWAAVRPTGRNCHWRLWSAVFGCGAVSWRMVVVNWDSGRELRVGVQLQHRPAAVRNLQLQIDCTLTLWGSSYTKRTNWSQSGVLWTVAEDAESAAERNPDMDMQLEMRISRKV